jgi:hypothetical protein
MDQKRSCRTFSHFESIPFPLEERAQSLLGFSVKSVKKSHNFECNAQNPFYFYPVVVLRAGMLQTSPLNKNFVLEFGVRCTRRVLDRLSSLLLVSLSSDVSIELGSTQSLCCFLPAYSVNYFGNTSLNSLSRSTP